MTKEELKEFFKNYTPQNTPWQQNELSLKNSMLTQDIDKFLSWNVLGNTMVVGNKPFVNQELEYLKGRSDWERWEKVILESAIGCPTSFPNHIASSANTIHLATHLALFEASTGICISDMEFIFEFGGGYGCMCRLIYNLGFKGDYCIFDLPSFNNLQEYYLTSVGVDTNGVFFISDVKNIGAFWFANQDCLKVFIATWSLSETEISSRSPFVKIAKNCNYNLFAYQDQFQDINNINYFEEVSQNEKFDWWEQKISYLPGSNYLFGRKK